MHCEEELQLTKKCLEIIRDYEFGVAIQTKSDLLHKKIRWGIIMQLGDFFV